MNTFAKFVMMFSVTAMLLAACSGLPVMEKTETDNENDAVFDTAPVVGGDENQVKHSIGNPAVWSIWQAANKARDVGDFDTAIVQIERALRIEPEDPVLWSRLAELNLELGNANQAEELANKSNSLTLDNNILVYRNWLIIARARRLLGDDVGAEEAEYMANTLIKH